MLPKKQTYTEDGKKTTSTKSTSTATVGGREVNTNTSLIKSGTQKSVSSPTKSVSKPTVGGREITPKTTKPTTPKTTKSVSDGKQTNSGVYDVKPNQTTYKDSYTPDDVRRLDSELTDLTQNDPYANEDVMYKDMWSDEKKNAFQNYNQRVEDKAQEYKVAQTETNIDKKLNDSNKDGKYTVNDVAYRDKDGKVNLYDYSTDLQNKQKEKQEIEAQIKALNEEKNSYSNDTANASAIGNINNRLLELREKLQTIDGEIGDISGKANYQEAFIAKMQLQDAKENKDSSTLDSLYDMYESYDDTFVERRLENVAKIGIDMAGAIASTVDIARDLGGELLAKNMERSAENLMKTGEISDDQYNQMLTQAKSLAEFDASSESNLSTMLRNASAQITYDIQNGEDGISKFIGEGLDSTANFMAQFLLLHEAGSLGMMALQSGTQKYFENLERGYSQGESLLNAVATGMTSYLTEKIGMDNFVATLNGTANQNIFGQVLSKIMDGKSNLSVLASAIASQGMAEGLEEVVEGNVDYILDNITAQFFNGEPVEYNAGDIFYGMMVGAFSGALMGVGGGTYNLVVNTREQYNSLQNDYKTALEIFNEARMKGETVSPELLGAIRKAELALNNFEARSQTMGVTMAEDMADTNLSLQETKQLNGEAIYPNVQQAYQTVEEQRILTERIDQATNDFLSMRGVNMPSDQFIQMSEQERADLLEKAPKINEAFPNAQIGYATSYVVDGEDLMANSNALVISSKDGKPYIVVNPKGETSVLVSAVHEAIHTIEGTEEYRSIHDTLFPTAQSELTKLNELLADRYKGFGLSEVDKEAVTITITEDMMKEEGADAFIEHLAKYNTSFAYKMLYNFRDALNLFNDSKLTQIERKLTSALNNQDMVYMPDGVSFSLQRRTKNQIEGFFGEVGAGKFKETPYDGFVFPLVDVYRDSAGRLRFKHPRWALELGLENVPHVISRSAVMNTQYDVEDPLTKMFKSMHHTHEDGTEQNSTTSKKNPIARSIITNIDLFYQHPYAVFEGKYGSHLVVIKATDSKGYPIIMPVYEPESFMYHDVHMGIDYEGIRDYYTSDFSGKATEESMTNSYVNLSKTAFGKNNRANIISYLDRLNLEWSEKGESKRDIINTIRKMQVNAKGNSYFDPTMLNEVTKSEALYTLEQANFNDGFHKNLEYTSDIHTFEEVTSDPDDVILVDDFTREDLQKALDTGKIKVYFRGDFQTGVWVSPSLSEAKSYKFDGKLFTTEANLTDIAWSDNLEGQFIKRNFKVKFSKMSDEDSDGFTLTQQQQDYFALSKARDDMGRLEIFFHGTNSPNFTVFDPAKTSFGYGFFFSNDRTTAYTYEGMSEHESTLYAPTKDDDIESVPNRRIYAVYLNMVNPLIVDCEGRSWEHLRKTMLNGNAQEYNFFKTAEDYNRFLSDYADEINQEDNRFEVRDTGDRYNRLALGKINSKGVWQELADTISSTIISPKYFFDYLNSVTGYNFNDQFYTTIENDSFRRSVTTDEIAEYAYDNGYDGVIFKNIVDTNNPEVANYTTTVCTAFNSNQIKSVSNRYPTSDPDIRYSRMASQAGIKSDLLDTQIAKQNVESSESKKIGTHLRDFNGVDMSTISTDDLYDEAVKLMESDDEQDLANASRRLQEIMRRYRYLYNTKDKYYMFPLDAFKKFPELSAIIGMGNQIANKFQHTYDEENVPWSEYLSDPENKARYDDIVKKWKEKFVKDEYLAKDGEKPTLTIVMGLPGAGKSVALEGENVLVLDNDDVKQLHPLFKTYKGIVSGAVHSESSAIMDDLKKELYGDDNLTVDEMRRRGMPVYNIAIPKIFGHSSDANLQREIDKARKKGYNINVKLVDISNEDSIVRNAGRYADELGRLIPLAQIAKYGDMPYKNFVSVAGKEENSDVTFKRYENSSEAGLLRPDKGIEGAYPQDTGEGNGDRGIQESSLSYERTDDTGVLRGTRSGAEGVISERRYNDAVNGSKDSFSNVRFSKQSNNDVSTNVRTDDVRHVDGEVTDGYAERKKQQFRENNLEKSTVLNEEQKERTRQMSAEGYFSYQSYINKVEVERAREYMERDGIDKTYNDFMATNDISMKTVVKGEVLLTEMAKNNDPRWEDVATKLADDSTVAGQTLQAYAILQRLSPKNQIVAVERSMRRMQTELDNKYGNKAPHLELPPELKEELRQAETAEQAQEAREKIMKNLIDQHPLTWSDRFDSWRYLAMLGNPRTHVRNFLGNLAFMPAVGLKNAIGTVLENALGSKLSYKTKSIVSRLNEADRALYKAGVEEFQKQRALQEKNKKYEQRGFGEKHKILNMLNEKNSWLLEAEDMFFSQDRYALSYAQFLKANNLTPDNMTAEQKVRANQYAYAESLKATYRDANSVASWLNELEVSNKKGLRNLSYLKKAILPFTKTPFNIVKRGVEYSGLGLLKSIYDGATAVRNGTMDVNTWIDEMSAGLSGTAIMGIGWLLSKMGWFKTKDDDKDRKKYFDKEIGEQDYAIDLGKGTYTLDWMSPVIMPLAMGAEFADAFTDLGQVEGADAVLDAFLNIATNLADPIVETSMLSSLQEAMSSYSNEGSAYLGDVITSAIASYIGQIFPTIGGQIARTVDDTRRTTSPNKGLIDKTVKQILNKIPFASKLNQPYINKKGQEEKTEDLNMGAFGRFILNTLSPGYYSSKDADKYDMEMLRLYEDSGEIDALPSSTTKSVTFNKETMKFSDKEYTEWHRTRWATESKYVNQFIDSSAYKSLSDEERVATIKDIRTYAQKVAKKQFLESKGYVYTDNKELADKQPDKYIYEKDLVNAEGALDNGVDLYAYYDYLGNAGTKQADKLKYLEESGMSKKQKDYLWGLSDYKTSYEDVYKKVFSGEDNSSSKKKKSSSGSKNGSNSKRSSKTKTKKTSSVKAGTSTSRRTSLVPNVAKIDTRKVANNYFKAYANTFNRQGAKASSGGANTNVCPKCGNRVPAGASRCPVCGTKLG